jgi:hypothetical protein
MASIFFTERLPGTSNQAASYLPQVALNIARFAHIVRYPISGVIALPPRHIEEISPDAVDGRPPLSLKQVSLQHLPVSATDPKLASLKAGSVPSSLLGYF